MGPPLLSSGLNDLGGIVKEPTTILSEFSTGTARRALLEQIRLGCYP